MIIKVPIKTLCFGYSFERIQCFCRPDFLGVINDPLFENLGVIGKFRGSELFLMYNYFLSEHASILKVFEECPLSKDKSSRNSVHVLLSIGL